MAEYNSVNLGRITPKYTGDYSTNVNYNTLDIVFYEGNSYIATQPSLRQTPAIDSEYWGLISSKGDKGDKGDKGEKGDKGDTGVVDTTPDYTWTGTNTFNKKIIAPAGVQGNADTADILNTRAAIFTDYADVANNMTKYSGNWYVQDNAIKNDPGGANGSLAWYVVKVTPAYGTNTGYIQITIVDGTTLSTGVDAGKIIGWHLMPYDSDVVHKTGNETIAGDKTFTSNTTLATTTILAGNYGLRVTPSGFQKTTDGKTWVSANI